MARTAWRRLIAGLPFIDSWGGGRHGELRSRGRAILDDAAARARCNGSCTQGPTHESGKCRLVDDFARVVRWSWTVWAFVCGGDRVVLRRPRGHRFAFRPPGEAATNSKWGGSTMAERILGETGSKRRRRFHVLFLPLLLAAAVALFTAGSALAVHDIAFQLDGDVSASTTTSVGGSTQTLDWDSLFTAAG